MKVVMCEIGATDLARGRAATTRLATLDMQLRASPGVRTARFYNLGRR